mgnify:CR=1 FL=1
MLILLKGDWSERRRLQWDELELKDSREEAKTKPAESVSVCSENQHCNLTEIKDTSNKDETYNLTLNKNSTATELLHSVLC